MAGIFGFFDYTKPGKGVSKDEPPKRGLSLYFSILFKRFWKIISLNLLYIVASIPAIIIAGFISVYFVTLLFSVADMDVSEMAVESVLLSVITTVAFLVACGSGPATTAMCYVLRKYVNDTHSWVWSDFVDNFKSNFKQGLCVYVINVLFVSAGLFSFIFYTFIMKHPSAYILRNLLGVVIVIFLMMQMYTYHLMAGFELKLKHIYKNAFYLTMMKLLQNVVTAAVTLAIMYGVYSVSMNIPMIGIIILATLFFTLLTFTQIFMTNNIVKKYVLEPFLKSAEE